MGLPPRDPRSRSKNMAMKMINKIGSKSFSKKPSAAPTFPGMPPGPRILVHLEHVDYIILNVEHIYTQGYAQHSSWWRRLCFEPRLSCFLPSQVTLRVKTA